MNNGMDREPRNMLDKDDQDWFALLTGQSVPDAATDTVREAQALRRAVLAEHATPADTATDQAGLDRLLFRLQRAGLLTPRRPVWRRPAFVSTVAAAMLAICILPLGLKVTAPFGADHFIALVSTQPLPDLHRALQALHDRPGAAQYEVLLRQHLQGVTCQMGVVGLYTAPASD